MGRTFRNRRSHQTFGPSILASGGGQPQPPDLLRVPFWVKGDAGVTTIIDPDVGRLLTRWNDQGTLHQDLDVITAGKELLFNVHTLDGVPGVYCPVNDVFTTPGNRYIGRATNLQAFDGKDFGLGPTGHPARTVMAVIIPRNCGISPAPPNEAYQTGGPVCNFQTQLAGSHSFDCDFFLQAYFDAFRPSFFTYSSQGGVYGPFQVRGPDTLGSVYADTPHLVEWRADWPSLTVAVDGSDLVLTPANLSGDANAYDDGAPAGNGFIVGNGTFGGTTQFQGDIFEIIVWDYVLTGATLTAARNYFAARYPSLTIV